MKIIYMISLTENALLVTNSAMVLDDVLFGIFIQSFFER